MLIKSRVDKETESSEKLLVVFVIIVFIFVIPMVLNYLLVIQDTEDYTEDVLSHMIVQLAVPVYCNYGKTLLSATSGEE